ncbi:Iron-sulfur cluster assembly 1 mitochondrial [Mactra antiquata]
MASKIVGATVRAVSRKRPIIPTKAPLVLTSSAVTKVKQLMNEKPDMIGLKIGVKTRGCNGLTYTLDYCTDKGKFDEIVEQDGVKVVIDAKAQLTLLGTEMDYVENKLAAEFIFNNPNIKGTCGCGESFNV